MSDIFETIDHLPHQKPPRQARVNSITPEIASLVKGMVARGDESQDIAIFFGFNMGRVADIKAGRIHPRAMPALRDELPPAGPYMTPHEIWSGAWRARVLVEHLDNEILPDLMQKLRQVEQSIKKRQPKG